jgi:3'-phosphoadenosine 5'-phosphosulfate sulfotransferase (PAPS reductase)/FAD synthetase
MSGVIPHSESNDIPSEQLLDALDRSDDVLREAQAEYEFDAVYAAVSGGNDSGTALDVAYESDEIDLDGILYIETGINVDQTREFVEAQADRMGLDFHPVGQEYALESERYAHLCQIFGFPGPIRHDTMYHNLKQKRLKRFLKAEHPDDANIGIISGVLADESGRRKMNIGDDPIEEKANSIWVSPLYDWWESTVDEYRDVFSLRENEVTAMLCVSGDCNCGAYGERNRELMDLLEWYPDAAEDIKQLERKVCRRAELGQIPAEYALWAHGRDADRETVAQQDDDQAAFQDDEADIGEVDTTDDADFPICTDCSKSVSEYTMGGDTFTVGEAYLNSDEFSLAATISSYCVECDIVVEDGRKHREEVHPDAGATPKALDIRAIPCRCSDVGGWRVTQGNRSTYNPDGEFCDGPTEHHDWEPYDGGNGVARRRCAECGAFEVPATPDDGFSAFPHSAATTPHDPEELRAAWSRDDGQQSLSAL